MPPLYEMNIYTGCTTIMIHYWNKEGVLGKSQISWLGQLRTCSNYTEQICVMNDIQFFHPGGDS
jgi:hypothetical protein